MTHTIQDWSALALTPDEAARDPIGGGARLLDLPAMAPLLASPDDGAALTLDGDGLTTASGARFPLIDGRPLLLPEAARRRFDGSQVYVPADAVQDAFDQYLYLNQVKNAGGEPNSAADDPWFLKHVSRSRRLLSDAHGVVLDIGCDNPELSRSLFPAGADYIGLEPALGRAPGLRLVAMAEFLPLKAEAVDAVSFMTSLDHVLDYYSAIDEAFRVLKPGGMLYLATLVWTERAALHRDNIHFHHFRDFEIQGALRAFTIESVDRYNWKHDKHRSGVYLRARKPR